MIRDKASLNDELLRGADHAETSKRSSAWGDFFFTLRLVGIALAVLGAIWAIDYWKSG